MQSTQITNQQLVCYAEGIQETSGIRSSNERPQRSADFLAGSSWLASILRRFRSKAPQSTQESEEFHATLNTRLSQVIHRDEGSNLVETALTLPILILLLIGCVDYGRGFYTAMEVSAAAESGALYGTLNPSDTTGMVAMAKMDAADVSNINATATYGCECADGSAASANCTSSPVCTVNVVQYVEVTTTAAYSPTLPYPGIPSSINLQNKVRLRASTN